jgi:hypothetical protein
MLAERNPSEQQGFAVVICKPTGCCVHKSIPPNCNAKMTKLLNFHHLRE